MKKIILIGFLIVSTQAKAETIMIQGNTINDKEKQSICTARSGRVVINDFLISKKYVEIKRESNADATFIAVNPENPMLMVCYSRSSTGKFEPAETIPQDKDRWTVIRPQNPIDFKTRQGTELAKKMCQVAVTEKIKGKDIRNFSTISIIEAFNPPHVGTKVGARVAERYDILSKGRVILNSSSNKIDLDSIPYTCLLEPSYNVKSLEVIDNLSK